MMQFGLRYSTSNVYYEGEYGASEIEDDRAQFNIAKNFSSESSKKESIG